MSCVLNFSDADPHSLHLAEEQEVDSALPLARPYFDFARYVDAVLREADGKWL